MLILYAFVAILALIYLWFKKKFTFWEKHGFPAITGKFPLGSIGEMGFKKHSCVVLKEFYDKHKGKSPAVGFYMMTAPLLLPTDPELIKDILVRHFDNFHDRGFYLNVKDDPLSNHLFFLSGQQWKDMRTKLSPTFTSGKIKMMFGNVSSISDKMIKYLAPSADLNESVEMKEILSSFTTEVISNVAFGIDTECLGNPKNEFRKMANRIFEPPKWEILKIMFMASFPEVSKKLGLGFNTQETTDFFMDVIRKSVEHRKINNIVRNDFLQLLIQNKSNSETDSGFSLEEIAANSFVFFLAGFETSSSVAMFTLYELAMNQDIQERLRQENDEVLEKHEGEITYDGIMEMKYLDMVFNESMRKYPVVDSQVRQSSKDFKIPNSNMTIPKDTLVMISSAALHHDERFFENPSKFDPERFTEENVKNRHPFAYIPFSEGPRICIGSRFGIMQTKIALVKLLRKYRFSPCDKTPNPIKFSPSAAFQSPVGGMWLKLENISR